MNKGMPKLLGIHETVVDEDKVKYRFFISFIKCIHVYSKYQISFQLTLINIEMKVIYFYMYIFLHL